MLLRLAGLGVWLLASSSAWAVQVTLTPSSPPQLYAPLGRAIDVDGLAPGMSVAAAKAALERQFGTFQASEGTVGFEEDGISVTSQPFTMRLAATKGGTEVDVWFAPPTTGNGLVQVTEQTIFPSGDTAPTVASLVASLTARYGRPALDAPALGTGEVRLLAWSYKGNSPSSCAQSSCRADLADGLSLAELQRYALAVRRGHELVLTALILSSINDPNQAASLVVSSNDMATKLKSADAALKQMREAVRAERMKPAK